jgi:hypothetical protein
VKPTALSQNLISRKVIQRTRGVSHGPIVRLMSPSDLGGKCPTKWAGLTLKYEHLPSNMSTGTKPPGKTALHQVYLLPNV